jgi:hypothetical protein
MNAKSEADASLPSRAASGERAVGDPILPVEHLLLLVNVLGLALAAMDAWGDWGPWSAYACVGVTSILYLAHVSWRRTRLLVRLLVFGLSGGLVELASDWWLVSVTKTLDYAQWGPFLVDSPAYMPMSWAGILLSMGFVGWVVKRRYGIALGMVAATLVSGVYVPVFEALAHYAGWWVYKDCPMWGPVPYYIIIGEALIGLALTPALVFVLAGKMWRAVVAGAAMGLWIGVAYLIGMVVT